MTGVFVQATGVVVDGRGVVIRGPSGSGKSDLALRLIDAGATLVADDGLVLQRRGGRLYMTLPDDAPPAVRGRLEVRGLGILPVPHVATAPVDLVVELGTAERIERLPAPVTATFLDLAVPLVRLAGLEASAAAKVRLAVATLSGSILPPP